MELTGDYRHELKYQVSVSEYLSIRQRLRAVMKPDSHTRADGTYLIRSIYFDNYEDKALREKVDGVQLREKFRIRYYNDDFSFFSLEKKIKHSNLCMKVDCPITEEVVRQILNGETDQLIQNKDSLVRELACKMQYQQLKPRVLVSYVREPYIYGPGNVRITFDSQIRTTLFHKEFLEKNVSDISATDSPSDMLMEVKFDAYIPDIILDLIQSGSIRQQAFSKYGACRRFG